MARHQLAQRDERKAQGSFCCSPRAGCRRTAAADQGQGSATSARRPGLADRRTQNIGREEILSRQPAGEDGPAHLGEHHQGAMDLRAGSPATERRTRSRSLRGPILARTASSRAHDDDRLRFPPVSPAQNRKAGKKESTGRRLSQPCPPCARPSSKSSLDHCRGDVPTAENGFATRYSVNKSAKVVLVNPNNRYTETETRVLQDGAHSLGLELHVVRASTASEIDTAFRTLAGLRPDALLVSADFVLLSRHKQLVALAAQHALPVVWPWREYAAAGGLMSYGTSL